MGFLVCGGAVLSCSFGAAPSVFNVLSATRVMAPQALATIMDNVPIVNIQPFGMCSSSANPTVAAATAAALGVLAPMPCIPVPAGPWVPGKPQILVGGKPALDDSCKLMCSYAGVIQVTQPGQFKIMA